MMAAAAAGAAAQTVTVLGAPAGSTLEVVIENQVAGSAAVDAMGNATVRATAPVRDLEARLYVEVCDTTQRIRLQSAAALLPTIGACTRRDAGSLFQVGAVTTFVIDLGGSQPIVRVRQGPAPVAWMTRLPEGQILPARDWEMPSPGLVLSAGGGITNGDTFSLPHCGDLREACSRSTFRPTYSAAATLWVNSFLGVQGSYTRATEVKAEGSGTGFSFDTGIRLEAMNVAGNLAFPIQSVARIYAIGGATFHRTKGQTTQTQVASGTIPAGSQRFEMRTEGWGLVYGGGFEVWANRRVAFFGEVTRSKIEATDLNGGEGFVSANVPYATAGLRFSLF